MSRRETDVLIALNNAWRVRDDFDVVLFANDFPSRQLPRRYVGELLSTANIEPAVAKAFGPLMFRGSTMAFNGIYYALSLAPAAVFAIGCDMDYRVVQGRTHFYGIGGVDPLRYNISLRSLQAKSSRALCLAAQSHVPLVRVCDEIAGHLALPSVSFADFESGCDAPPVSLFADQCARALEAEKNAPFDATIKKYWKYNDDEAARRYVDTVDSLWQAAVSF
jgi:hypothetical protein